MREVMCYRRRAMDRREASLRANCHDSGGHPLGCVLGSVALAVAWGAVAPGCGGGASHGQQRKPGPRVFAVHVETVRTRSLSDDVVATGTAQPAREVTLSPQVQGMLVYSKVELSRWLG